MKVNNHFIKFFSYAVAWHPKWLYGSFHLFSLDARKGYTAHFICIRLMPEAAIQLISYVFAWCPKRLYGLFHMFSLDTRSGYTTEFTCFHLTLEVAIWLNSFISFILHDIGGGVTCLFHFTWHRWWCHLFHSFCITSVVVSFVSFVLYDISGGVICFIHFA